VSSFFTAHQHRLGYTVPLIFAIDVKCKANKYLSSGNDEQERPSITDKPHMSIVQFIEEQRGCSLLVCMVQ